MDIKVLHVVSISFSLKYFIGNQFLYFRNLGVKSYVACSDSTELFELASKYDFVAYPLPIKRSIDPIQDLLSIINLRKFIARERFDYVIAHSPKGGLIGMTASYLARVPNRIFFRHGLVFETSTGVKRKLLINIEKIIGAQAHKVVNVSQSVQNIAINLHLNRDSKNVLLGKGTCNGVNTDLFKFRSGFRDDSVTTIGYVGRLAKDKGIGELTEAWKILAAKHRDIKLLLIGPFDERDKLDIDTIEYIRKCKSIELVGEISDTSTYYNMMDIFILPSYREGFPTVVLEASSSSLPIITTRSTGCIDSIIENQTGIFVEINGSSIANGIEKYLFDTELRKKHGAAGRDFVSENFSEQIVYREIGQKIYSLK
ncbi:Glycogen synthase [Sphingobacterium multivorum]|uniref:glycosyltransferase family 4 protein n=1 Tax=Sphingobacterium multivorum TaxID=28454 RepID=UPI000E01ED6B|nr:glycosyltransferase family 4 protein [Sphingobacterium multivorum]QQT43605.1 glycosyltransferase family 4 protein [Sphingobacterium multivorum]SUI97894.1 Glycogen synthase [Sphingobacterium multivorum]